MEEKETPIPILGKPHIHHTSKGLYTPIIITNIDTENHEKYPVTVVYVGENGKLWSRPFSEWSRSFQIKYNGNG